MDVVPDGCLRQLWVFSDDNAEQILRRLLQSFRADNCSQQRSGACICPLNIYSRTTVGSTTARRRILRAPLVHNFVVVHISTD